MKIPILNIILVFWWMFLLAISHSNISNIYPPSHETTLIIIIGILTMGVGGFIGLFIPSIKFETNTQFLNNKRIKNILFLLLVIALIPLFNFSKFIYDNGFLDFRSIAFTINEDTGENVVFGNLAFLFILTNYLKPFLYSIVIYCIYLLVYENNNNNFKFSIFVLTIFSISTLGRFFLYHLFVIIIISYLLKINMNDKKIFVTDIKIIAKYSIFTTLLFLILSYFRDFKKLLTSVIDYHIIGFQIFSQEISDKASTIHSSDIFFTSLGIIERTFSIILSKFGYSIVSYVDVNEKYLSNFRVIGEGKTFNAYSTWFYSLYFDGGIKFICIYLFFFGLLLTYFEKCFYIYKDARSFLLAISMFFISFFSVFTSMIQNQYILIPFFLLFISQPQKIQ